MIVPEIKSSNSDNDKKISFFKHFVIPLVISLFILIVICIAGVLQKYSDDIFDKNLDVLIQIKFFILFILVFILPIFLISIVLSLVVYFKKRAEYGIPIKKTFYLGLFFLSIVAFSCFYYTSYIKPTINLKMAALLYDIRSSAPTDSVFVRVDQQLFKGYGQNQTNEEILIANDSLRSKIASHKPGVIMNEMLSYISLKQIDSVFDGSKLFLLGYTKNDMKRECLSEEIHTPSEKICRSINAYVEAILADIENYQFNIRKNEAELFERYSVFFTFILAFIFSAFIGILNKRNKIIFVFIGLLFFMFPTWFFIQSKLKKMAMNSEISIFSGVFGPVMILLLIDILLLLIIWRKSKKII